MSCRWAATPGPISWSRNAISDLQFDRGTTAGWNFSTSSGFVCGSAVDQEDTAAAMSRGSTSRRALVILMTMTSFLSLAEVKAHLSELVGRVSRQHDRVTVTVHGKPSAVLVAVDDLEALEETIAVLSDPDAMRQLARSDAEVARGEGETEALLAEAMRRRTRA